MVQRISGTKEWAAVTVNCSIGCLNNCGYCYSRRISFLRRDINSFSEWTQVRSSKRNKNKENRKHEGTVMFPSMHDIHEENLEECIDVIANLLEAGNKVLIVSKPNLNCIFKLCETFKEWKHKILFRFTIGTFNDQILKAWEPGAPKISERLACLAYAKTKGFQTSVSMEPMLDSSTVVEDAKALLPFVTDTLWIGKMNKVRERAINISREEINRIETGQSDQEIKRIYQELKDQPKIRWKESFKEVLGLELSQELGLDK